MAKYHKLNQKEYLLDESLLPPTCITAQCQVSIDTETITVYHNNDKLYEGDLPIVEDLKMELALLHIESTKFQCPMCHGKGCEDCGGKDFEVGIISL